MHQRSADSARDRLIESHLPLVKALARRYAGLGAELDDLVQVGALGLVKASDRFDPGKGVAFASFAAPTIEGEIRHHLRDRSSGLRIPRQLQRLSRDIRRCQSDLTTRLGRSPSTAEVAAALDTDADEVERALAAERARDSLSLSGEEDRPAAAGSEPATGADDRLMLAASMRALSRRERHIVYLRFHADKTERQIAAELGISQAHVSRLLAGALAKLRHSLQDDSGAQSVADISQNGVISPALGAGKRDESTANRASRAAAGGGRTRNGGPGPGAERPPTAQDMERLRAAILKWLSDEREEPEAMPQSTGRETATPDPHGSPAKPKSSPSHSGRFLVRMPSSLHEQLARAAERENVSLNRFVTDALAATVSSSPEAPVPGDDAAADAPPSPAAPTRPPARTVRAVLAANLVVLVFAAAVAVVLLVLALQRGL